MQSLYIVDAVNFLFRAYYAIGPMTNPKGHSTNALYGFIRSIYKIITDFSPNYFIAVFDGPDNKKSRVDLYSEYKSHRTGMPEDLFPQLDLALKFCEIAGIPHLSLPGVEADDTMGSIAKWAEKKGISVFLCSSDKDLCQLVDTHIKVINPHKDNLLIDRDKVKELFGVWPEQMIDYLAIVGDASDNIPGLEGFGPKTAASLLSSYHSLDYLLAHPDILSGKKRETLLQSTEIALLSRQLAKIQVDLDIPQEESFYHLKAPDLSQIRDFYHEMHFLSLLRELDGNRDLDSSQQKIRANYQCINDMTALEALLALCQLQKEIAIDTETTSLRPMEADLVGLGLTFHPAEGYYIPFNGSMNRSLLIEMLKPLLENPEIAYVGHHIKYDLHVLANAGIHVSCIGFDTLIASYLTSPHIQRHGLDQLALTHFSHIKISIEDLIGKGKNQKSMDQVPIDKICEYCCEDVDYTLRLKEKLALPLEKEGLFPLFTDIEIPLIPVLMRMERKGIYIDTEVLKTMSKEVARDLLHLETQIHHLAGESFNINSPKQLSTLLFDKMGITPPKKTLTGYSTSAEVLESLKHDVPIVQLILDYRTLEKLRSTYIDTLPEQVLPSTQRIHCTFNQSITATGRLSCQDPNLQNIPIRTELGKKIRTAFKPQNSSDWFLSADYSQIELRLLAHLSEDPILIQAFEEGEDIHAHTASQVFGIPLKEVTSHMRHQAKAVNFGIIYGQQAYGLSKELGIPLKDAALFIETYFKRYKKIKDFLEFCKEATAKTGYAITLIGRKRPIPDILSKNSMLRTQAERLAINTPLQGTAADLIKIAMLSIDSLLQKEPELGAMLLQIHDELLFETPQAQVDLLAKKVKKIMESAMQLKVPLVVDISIGKNWGEC